MSATFGTRLFTWFFGTKVGADAFGNEYYREKGPARGRRERRWVIYRDAPEGSAVPPEWQSWLTHTACDSPVEKPPAKRPWQRTHQPNLTGTGAAYRPPGALLKGGERTRATGDYEPWVPD